MLGVHHPAMSENETEPGCSEAGASEAGIVTLGRVRPRSARPAALAGVAIAALAGGAGAAYAATHSPAHGAADAAAVSSAASPGPSASPAGPRSPWKPGRYGGPWRGFGFAGWAGLGGGRIVHGQVVVPKSGGGYQTLDVQEGQVTAVSSASVTVRSSDGYTATYVVTSSTVVDAQAAGIGSVKTGDTVDVTATVSGSTATAASITDPTAIRAGRGSFGFRTAPPTSSPSSSAS